MVETPDMVDAPFHTPPDDGPDPVTITVLGNPRGKERARAFAVGGKIGHYTPKATRTYEFEIAMMARLAMGNRKPFTGPVEFVMRAVFDVPTSWPKKKKAAALCGLIKPIGRPDFDNLAKVFGDSFNRIVYRDDAQIVKASFEKRYGPKPMVIATVREAR